MDENKTKAFLDKKYADLTKGVLVEQSASIDQEPIAVTKEDEDGDFICELNISPPDYDICNHVNYPFVFSKWVVHETEIIEQTNY